MFRLDHLIYIIANSTNGYQTKQAKNQLIEKGHAECHPIVFYEADIEPIRDSYRLAQTKMGLDGNLDNLVNDEQDNDQQARYPAISKKSPCV
jgi:hypothetical protein